jgi:soluble cytochrome b562
MHLRSLVFCSVIALTSASSVALAQAPAAPATPAAADHKETTELGGKMGAIGKAFKKLRGQINDASKNEDSLKLVATIRENAEAALKYTPEKAADLPAADQAKFKADYAEHMKAFAADVDKLDAALKAGDNATAAKLVDTLNNDQKEGHKEFRKKKPEKK